MSSERLKIETVDEYIGGFSGKVRSTLKKIRYTIQQAAPNALETISYQMPAYKNGQVMFYFGAYQNHISLTLPHPAQVYEAFKNQLSGYDISKSTIRFPLDEAFPFDLLSAIAEFRIKEYETQKIKAKKSRLSK